MNKLSINVKKTKMQLFHMPQKKVNIPIVIYENTKIECVDDFNFLGIILNKHMNWNSHLNKISNTISKAICILNKVKHFVPDLLIISSFSLKLWNIILGNCF